MRILSKTPPPSRGWNATRWSMVTSLTDRADPRWQTSWTTLAEGYRRPLEAYTRRVLARGPGGSAAAQDAGDVVQDFLTTCVEKAWLSRADPEKGRFRAFIQTLLRRYITGLTRQRLAQKRSPGDGRRLLPLQPGDQGRGLVAENPEDLAAFDRSWTEVAIERALSRLRDENARYHTVIRNLIDTGGEGETELAGQLGLRRAQLPVLKHRARRRFSALFEDEFRATVSDPEAFDEEWRVLQPYMP